MLYRRIEHYFLKQFFTHLYDMYSMCSMGHARSKVTSIHGYSCSVWIYDDLRGLVSGFVCGVKTPALLVSKLYKQ